MPRGFGPALLSTLGAPNLSCPPLRGCGSKCCPFRTRDIESELARLGLPVLHVETALMLVACAVKVWAAPRSKVGTHLVARTGPGV